MGEILRLVGAGPYTAEMVLDSEMVLSIQEDLDFSWWIRHEYRYKGRNRLGFKTHAHKMISNKYPGRPTPELLDDWDKR